MGILYRNEPLPDARQWKKERVDGITELGDVVVGGQDGRISFGKGKLSLAGPTLWATTTSHQLSRHFLLTFLHSDSLRIHASSSCVMDAMEHVSHYIMLTRPSQPSQACRLGLLSTEPIRDSVAEPQAC